MDTTESPKHGTPGTMRDDAAVAAVILLLGGFLAATGNSLVQRWQHPPGGRQTMGFEDQIGLAATLAGLIVLGWWATSAVIAITAAALERSGRTRAAAVAGSLSPVFMRRLALAVFGLQLVAAPLASASAPHAGLGVPRTVEFSVAAALVPADTLSPRADRVVDSGHAAGARAPATVPWLPATPRNERFDDGPAGIDPRWKPPAPAVEPGSLATRQLRSAEQTGAIPVVTVRTGDSLWSLTAAALGPYASEVDIARAWPRLYQANREVIGDDPHLLHPGQVLRLPPRT